MQETRFLGKTITRDDILAAMEQFDKERRATFPPRKWKTYAVEHNDKLYPPKETFRIVTGTDAIGPGGQPINKRYEQLGFKIVTLSGLPDEETEREEQDDEVIETSVSLERDLEDHLAANISKVEAGLRLYQEDGVNPRQLDTRVVGIIDLLAVDRLGRLVVLELKAGEANDRVCGQIQRYMGWVMDTVAHGKEVRGVVVANSFSDGLRYAVRMTPSISLKKYVVSFQLSDA
jgi:hypothetical protein